MNMLSMVSHAGLEPGELRRWLGPANDKEGTIPWLSFSAEDDGGGSERLVRGGV